MFRVIRVWEDASSATFRFTDPKFDTSNETGDGVACDRRVPQHGSAAIHLSDANSALGPQCW